jgi:hypothetical protein
MLAAIEEVSNSEVSNRCSLYQAPETGAANPPPQYHYLFRHSQFPISLLQMMHLPWDITLWSPIPSNINQHPNEYSITGYPEHAE